MERRGFLKMLVGGVAVAAASQTFPFRVFSFPTNPEVMPTFDPRIAGWVKYSFHMTVTVPPDNSVRFRFIDSTNSIVKMTGKPYQTYMFGERGSLL